MNSFFMYLNLFGFVVNLTVFVLIGNMANLLIGLLNFVVFIMLFKDEK